MAETTFRDRAFSCQAGAMQSARSACVSKALENLRRIQAAGAAGAAGKGKDQSVEGGVRGEALHGAVQVVRRLQEELQRIARALEHEQHTRAILQGKLDALDAHHQANIAAAAARERGKCASEIETLLAAIDKRSRLVSAKDEELAERAATVLELDATRAELARQAEDVVASTTLEQQDTQHFAATNTKLRAQRDQQLAARNSLAQALAAAGKQESEVVRACAGMVSEADVHVMRLQTQLAAETKIRIAAQNALDGVHVRIEESAKPLPTSSGLDLELPLAVIKNLERDAAQLEEELVVCRGLHAEAASRYRETLEESEEQHRAITAQMEEKGEALTSLRTERARLAAEAAEADSFNFAADRRISELLEKAKSNTTMRARLETDVGRIAKKLISVEKELDQSKREALNNQQQFEAQERELRDDEQLQRSERDAAEQAVATAQRVMRAAGTKVQECEQALAALRQTCGRQVTVLNHARDELAAQLAAVQPTYDALRAESARLETRHVGLSELLTRTAENRRVANAELHQFQEGVAAAELASAVQCEQIEMDIVNAHAQSAAITARLVDQQIRAASLAATAARHAANETRLASECVTLKERVEPARQACSVLRDTITDGRAMLERLKREHAQWLERQHTHIKEMQRFMRAKFKGNAQAAADYAKLQQESLVHRAKLVSALKKRATIEAQAAAIQRIHDAHNDFCATLAVHQHHGADATRANELLFQSSTVQTHRAVRTLQFAFHRELGHASGFAQAIESDWRKYVASTL